MSLYNVQIKHLNLAEARNRFPALINEVMAKNREIIITRRGKPVAKLTPCETPAQTRSYPLRSVPITISPDFNEPMPELWEALKE